MNVDPWEIRRALWRTKRWDKSLDVDAAAAEVAAMLAPTLALELQVRNPHVGFFTAHDEVTARLTARMRNRLLQVQADLEADGFALCGSESLGRVLDAAVAALSSQCEQEPVG